MQDRKKLEKRKIEILVGFFVLFGFAALLMLSLKVVSGQFGGNNETYRVYAYFDNIGGLKSRSPVKIGGVVIGRVASIDLDPERWTPVVSLDISTKYDELPETTSAAILTSGLLGEQYIGIQPGFMDDEMDYLKEGDAIQDTSSALVLEDLIGKFLFGRNE